MFEKALADKLIKIFDLKKVTFAAPGESLEQECLFIEVDNPRVKISDGKAHARVSGKVALYSPATKLPFGYFAKCIDRHQAECKDLFFSDIEENARVFQDIVRRGFSFVYFFNSQHDPALGRIESITTEVVTI